MNSIRTGQVKPERLITHRFRLEDIQTAYDLARRGGPVIKVVVNLNEEET